MDTSLNHKNLKLLWWLRNIALLGQAAAILIVTRGLHATLPESPLWNILLILLLVNTLTFWRIKKARTIRNREFFIQLLVDVSALGGLLYYTGGATNPFASLFILQVIIAAVTLPPVFTWVIAAITVILYTVLMFWNRVVPDFTHHHMGDFFTLHVQGMWLSFLLLAGMVAWFVVRMNSIIRRQNTLLAEAEKLAALGTLATSAAHELATPLSIMAVINEVCEPPHIAREYASQIAKCKQILSRITAAGGVARAESGAPMRLDNFLNDTIAHWRETHSFATLETRIQGDGQFRIAAEQVFQQALMNLLDNAAEASPDYVKFEAEWDEQILKIIIRDHGEGVAEEAKESIGEAGFTTKPHGFGLGVFLAKSVIARLEGTFDMVSKTGKGTTVTIRVPLSKLAI